MAQGQEEREWMDEKRVIFRRAVWAVAGLIAAVFVLMLWVVGEPDTYHEHLTQQPPAAVSPDGSAKSERPGG
jgi:hypothetical protein